MPTYPFIKCPECGARVAENWLLRHMRREHARADPPSAAILEQVRDLGRRLAGINVYLPVDVAHTEVLDCYGDLQDLVLMLEAEKEEVEDCYEDLQHLAEVMREAQKEEAGDGSAE